jgi:hypothetical protein
MVSSGRSEQLTAAYKNFIDIPEFIRARQDALMAHARSYKI